MPTIRPFFQGLSRGEFRGVTSVVTLLAVLVHPFQQGDSGLAQQYREILLHSQGLTCVELTCAIAEEAARLRSNYNLRTPDAIHMATAINAGAASFVTNDARLPSLPGLRLVMLDELGQEEPT